MHTAPFFSRDSRGLTRGSRPRFGPTAQAVLHGCGFTCVTAGHMGGYLLSLERLRAGVTSMGISLGCSSAGTASFETDAGFLASTFPTIA